MGRFGGFCCFVAVNLGNLLGNLYVDADSLGICFGYVCTICSGDIDSSVEELSPPLFVNGDGLGRPALRVTYNSFTKDFIRKGVD